jgi:hypothetical protein
MQRMETLTIFHQDVCVHQGFPTATIVGILWMYGRFEIFYFIEVVNIREIGGTGGIGRERRVFVFQLFAFGTVNIT